jgi:hypothetical protein
MSSSLLTRPDLIAIYLNDHLAGATAGVELSARIAQANRGGPGAATLATIAREIAEDRDSLAGVMRVLGVSSQRYKILAGWTAEKLGRLKPNGHLVSRSPLSSLIELEGLRLGVGGKVACWTVLRALAARDDRLDVTQLDLLLARAERQAEQLDQLHADAAADALVSE